MYSSSGDLKIFYQVRTTLHVRTPQFSMHIFTATAQSRSQSLQNVPLDKGNADLWATLATARLGRGTSSDVTFYREIWEKKNLTPRKLPTLDKFKSNLE